MNKENNIYIIDNNSLQDLLRFYLSDGILYCTSNKGTTENDIKIIDDVKNYDLCIDNNQRIHILCVINSGKLVYLALKDAKWHKNTLHTFPSDVNSIDQVKILAIDSTIHIFYNFKFTAPKIKFYNYKSFIMHGYKTEYEWIQSYIGTFHQPNNPKYFIEFDSDQNLHFFYLSHNQKFSSINTLVFNKNKMKWFEPESIKSSILNAELFQVLLDTNDKIHLILKDINTYHVYHYFTDNSSDKHNKYTLISSNKDAFDYKIFEYNKKLCISWKSRNSISYINSDDLGKTWSNILEHSLPKIKELKYFNINNDMKAPKSLSTFGYLENNEMFILGITDMPKVENNVIETDTTNNDLDFNYEITNSKTKDFDIQSKERNEQSLWKKITNYLTLKE